MSVKGQKLYRSPGPLVSFSQKGRYQITNNFRGYTGEYASEGKVQRLPFRNCFILYGLNNTPDQAVVRRARSDKTGRKGLELIDA